MILWKEVSGMLVFFPSGNETEGVCAQSSTEWSFFFKILWRHVTILWGALGTLCLGLPFKATMDAFFSRLCVMSELKRS